MIADPRADEIIISPFQVGGEIDAPGSKSYIQRAIALATLHGAPVCISGMCYSQDAKAALGIARAMGCMVNEQGCTIEITPTKHSTGDSVSIHCGEAGLSTRMFSPIVALKFKRAEVNGSGSILTRPMDMVVDALEQMGAKVESQDGSLPLIIHGPILPKRIQIDGSESSQLLTGLLIASSAMDAPVEISVAQLKSIPYVDMTMDIMRQFGREVGHENHQTFFLKGKGQTKAKEVHYKAEGDWSGASFLIVAACLNGALRISNLKPNSAQADRAILEVLPKVGVPFVWEKEELFIQSPSSLNPFEFDATHCPDLFPPLAALAANAQGESVIHGVSRLASKESNRGLTIQQELKALGIEVFLEGNYMRIQGGKVSEGSIYAHEDHRIAMMAALMAMNASGPVLIKGAQAITKSYPHFFEDLNIIGQKK